MRPLKFMWNVGVKYPAKAAGLIVQIELKGWMRELLATKTKQKHHAAGELDDVPPPTFQRGGIIGAGAYGRDHVPVDIDGSHLSLVKSEHSDFMGNLQKLEPGLVLVTARIEPDSKGVRGIAAYVQGLHVGWVEPRAVIDDWHWIKQLNKRGFLPRFKGYLADVRGGGRYVAFLIPKWSEWKPTPSQLEQLGPPSGSETTREWLDRMKREGKE